MDIAISGESIKLGQFLKLANLVETGGHAKEVIASGEVQVNGEVVTQRGKTLRDGDQVLVGGVTATVSTDTDATNAGDYFDERTANDDFDPEKWRDL
ncbi:RNA-binding S4 domain-containing protein [Corynebacterium cystitidis]|uniref:Ribosome-associated protein YbcJ, S4-like RNA binding protein n=1 Tax=Corynebacterium cystitidis DSM 20524 TaxID=1121357 RepID=A0A1H9U3X0_9CORY|nr:RNA-binding S4 domain-containing protein [Corynebacterium cystitidis]WJY81151.1 ribosome-associated protein [Corynebacterium cystitidis DSM 20524]SES03941.1 Ribosome-associated protein YbcJ, S4-like RNA binding protein [Corynebacterium cystitidis DSM 20524]SNV89751.1 ribosome-associated protein [Corynebacterium cystitidis]